MNNDLLVSIVTPCYNGELFIFRLLDSILKQTYSKIELVFVDDGSKDNTKSVVESYVSRFEQKGYSIIYKYQDNAGQAAALDAGLKLYTGELFTWIDSDDFYSSDTSIAELAAAIKDTGDDVGLVMCQGILLDEETLSPIREMKLANRSRKNLFDSCVLDKHFTFMCGSYMTKSVLLKQVLVNNSIFTDTQTGQNRQMLLPLFYKKECIYINKPLINYLARKTSHSRSIKDVTLTEKFERLDAYKIVLDETVSRIRRMPELEKEYYFNLVQYKYLKKKFEECLKFKDYEQAQVFYGKMKTDFKYFISTKDVLSFKIMKSPFLIKVLNKIDYLLN